MLHLAFLGSLGWQELILIFVIILLLFGAKRLPEIARSIGRSMFEFKKAASDAKKELEQATREEAEKSKPEEKKG